MLVYRVWWIKEFRKKCVVVGCSDAVFSTIGVSTQPRSVDNSGPSAPARGGRPLGSPPAMCGFLHDLSHEHSVALGDLKAGLPDVLATLKRVPTLWGVPLPDGLPDTKPDALDIVLLKFLRADSFALDTTRERLRACLAWRAAADVDVLGAPGSNLKLGAAFVGHDVLRGRDRGARPLVISRFGTMDVERVFGDPEKFLLWRVQLMERAVAQLPFERGAPETLCQVHDYADCAVIGQDRRITDATKLFSQCMGAYYPELKGKTLLINVPDVYSILLCAASAFMPSRTVAKFTLRGSAYHETLYDAVSPEHIPARYGGLRRDDAAVDAAATAATSDDNVWANALPATVLSAPARGAVAHSISIAGPGSDDEAARRRLVRWRFRVPDGEVRATVVIDAGGDGVDGVAATASAAGADNGVDSGGGGDDFCSGCACHRNDVRLGLRRRLWRVCASRRDGRRRRRRQRRRWRCSHCRRGGCRRRHAGRTRAARV